MRHAKLYLTILFAAVACSDERPAQEKPTVVHACLGPPTCFEADLPEDNTEYELDGCYSCCFEVGDFVPRGGSRARWWVAGYPPAFQAEFVDLAGKELQSGDGVFTVRVRVKGTVSKLGSYGHMGTSSRELRISSYSGMNAVSEPQDCE